MTENGELQSESIMTVARPHAVRLRLQSYPIVGHDAARFADMDANGHLNNLALETVHENARALLNARAFPGVYDVSARHLRLVSSQNVVHFLAEAHWPCVIDTGVGVGRIGRTSFVASSALFANGRCISVCDTVLVAVNDAGPAPIPEQNRNILQAWMISG